MAKFTLIVLATAAALGAAYCPVSKTFLCIEWEISFMQRIFSSAAPPPVGLYRGISRHLKIFLNGTLHPYPQTFRGDEALPHYRSH